MGKTIRKRYLLSFFRLKNKDFPDEIKNSGTVFESTDYFDKLIVKEIDNKQGDLADFMGIRSQLGTLKNVVAVQNYSLFSDVDEEKGKETDALFSLDESEKFLSLIQVYITPEVIFKLPRERIDYFAAFEKKIKEILDVCRSELDVNAGVFRMMSGGDFMIVVRSKVPESAYLISTQIRRMLIHVQNKRDDRLALFKTHTILSYAANKKAENTDPITGTVVTRGRYSNQYWKDFQEDSDSLQLKEVKNMNGRYDLAACMTWEELEDITGDDTDTGTGTVKYITYINGLLKSEKISYFNKRYLMDSDKIWGDKYKSLCGRIDAHVDGIYLDSQHEAQYLMGKINDACEKKLKKISDLRDRSDTQSIKISLDILKGLVFLCQTVNSLSDMRIYVQSLLRQIQVVLDCAEEWQNLYKSGKNSTLLHYLEVYLRQAAVDLESYGSVIRDDNLQTLHAPSYHVVTGSSVEKILISYSRFLNEMMKFCSSRLKRKNLGKEDAGNKKYEAVMVPQLDKDSLEVEVLFPEWIQENQGEKFLLTARGPSTEELVNVPKMITALFHEMAHQLRYECREERNKILRSLFAEGISDALTDALFEQLGLHKLESDITDSMKVIFSKVICAQLQGIVLKDVPDECLERYKETLQQKTDRFFQVLQTDEDKLKMLVQRYITDTSEYIDGEKTETWEALNRIHINIQAFKNPNSSKSEEEKKAELCASLDRYAELCGQTAEKIWWEAGERKKGEDDKEIIFRMLASLKIQINKYTFSITRDEKEQKNRFLRNVFNELCRKWSKKMRSGNADNRSFTPEQKEWIRLGRKFGIDHGKNREHFEQTFVDSITRLNYYPFAESLRNLELYREETSDIFMVAMCGLEIEEFISYSAQLYPHHNGQYAPGNLERAADVALLFWGKECISEPDSLEQHLWSSQMLGKIYECLIGPLNGNSKPAGLIQELQDYAKQHKMDGTSYTALFTVQLNAIIGDRANWIKTRKYLYDDLIKGKEIYKRLRESITDDDVSYQGRWKQFVKTLCDINKMYFQITGYGKDAEKMEDCRKEIENFLINMHAYDRLVSAQEEGKDGCQNNESK